MDIPSIDPIAFEIGPLVIRWYALAYLAGFLLGWRYALRLAYSTEAEGRPHKLDIDDFMVWAIPAVILGGRLGYVLFYNAPYYVAHPVEILKIWEGGMSFHGGVIGMAAAMLFYARRHKFSVLKLSDIISCVAPIGLFFGRIANFVNAELYGRVTDVAWGVVFPHTDGQPRHPSQLYEAALEGAVIFIVMMVLVKMGTHRVYKGLMTGVFLMLYGSFRFLIEYVREPDAHIGLLYNVISTGQLLCMPMVLVGGGLVFYAIKTKDVSQNHSDK